MTAVIVAFQRATSDPPENAYNSRETSRRAGGATATRGSREPCHTSDWGYVTVCECGTTYESTLMSSLHLYMLQSWERGHTPGKLVLPFSMVAKTALKPLIFNFRQS